MLKNTVQGILAGILISIGGAVYLSCDNKYVGAVLFSTALMCICYMGYYLYTGKICFIIDNHKKDDVSLLLLCLLGNTIATVVCGYALRYAIPAIGETAFNVCSTKLTQAPRQTFIRAIFCGILVYLAVVIFRDKKTPLGIIFCIPVFILSGFEHSIADIFYFATSGIVSLKAFVFLWIVIAGNSVGGLLLPVLNKIGNKKNT